MNQEVNPNPFQETLQDLNRTCDELAAVRSVCCEAQALLRYDGSATAIQRAIEMLRKAGGLADEVTA